MATQLQSGGAAPIGTPQKPFRGHGLYVHVPFCARTCDFCAFYQVRPQGDDLARYLDTVRAELDLLPRLRAWDTVFFGGGTPGLLPPAALERLCRAVLDRTQVAPSEWTVELAPTTVRADRLRVLRACGITRVSLGVQSFQPRLLDALGRPHSVDQVLRAWDLIAEAGFPSRNVDLIFAIPGQSVSDWDADLSRAVALGPEHLSTYCLTLEEDTALYLRLARGAGRVPAELEEALFIHAHEALGMAGYVHYEVSNFARPGHGCLHNLSTWRMGTWDGVGPSAASQDDGERYANPADLEAWERDIAASRRGTYERTTSTPAQRAVDRLVFGLRTAEGVGWDEVREALGSSENALVRVLRDAETDGLVIAEAGRWKPALRGLLLADALGREILSAAESS